MSIGGNKNLAQFFTKYDLNEEPASTKYRSHAAEYYRQKLRSMADGNQFLNEIPVYEKGRELIIE